MTIDTSGFYKLDDELLYAPNFVLNAKYELKRDQKDSYQLPIDGWYWFNDEVEARVFFNLPQLPNKIEE